MDQSHETLLAPRRQSMTSAMWITQLLIGVVVFIFSVALECTNFGYDSTAYAIEYAIPVIIMSIGAGVAGSLIDRHDQPIYKMAAESIYIVLSAMNGTACLAYALFQCMITWLMVEEGNLKSRFPMGELLIVTFCLVFINMVVSFGAVTVHTMRKSTTASMHQLISNETTQLPFKKSMYTTLCITNCGELHTPKELKY